MVKVSGDKIFAARLKRIKDSNDPIEKALYQAGEVVREEAVASIRDGSIMGLGHIPSSPGEPPNADTGNLDKSIDVVVSKTGKSIRVEAKAEYAAALEFGTSRVAARPFMRPALLKHRNRIVYGFVQAVNDTVRVYKGEGARARARARYISRNR